MRAISSGIVFLLLCSEFIRISECRSTLPTCARAGIASGFWRQFIVRATLAVS
jgi:hypothetical protein